MSRALEIRIRAQCCTIHLEREAVGDPASAPSSISTSSSGACSVHVISMSVIISSSFVVVDHPYLHIAGPTSYRLKRMRDYAPGGHIYWSLAGDRPSAHDGVLSVSLSVTPHNARQNNLGLKSYIDDSRY